MSSYEPSVALYSCTESRRINLTKASIRTAGKNCHQSFPCLRIRIHHGDALYPSTLFRHAIRLEPIHSWRALAYARCMPAQCWRIIYWQSIAGKPLKPYQARSNSLYLLSWGARYAIASWGSFNAQGEWVWHWKDWRRFTRRFQGS